MTRTIEWMTALLRRAGIDPATGEREHADVLAAIPSQDGLREEIDPETWRAAHAIHTPNGPKEV